MPDPHDGKPPGMSEPEAAPLVQLGEYQLLEPLGEGGMGLVYKAIQPGLDRVVALKILPRELAADAQAVGRFQREMKAVGRLDHPNIVRAYDAREIEGHLVLVMECVEGLDLAELVDRLGPLPVADACELVRQAAVGLHYAHEHGLVHRDVKPSNLMLGRDGGLKILDLGLALVHATWLSDVAMTAPGQVVGTPDFLAPEQVSDSHTVDARADLYSLGCTLYKLLAGQPPFADPEYPSALEKIDAHVNEPVPPIRRFRPDVPEPLVAVLDRLLAKVPRDRFATAGEVADALGPFAAGCDLPRLVSDAERRPKPPKRQAERVIGVHRTATSTTTATPRHRPTERRRPPSPPTAWWRKPRAIAAGLALLVVAVGLTWAIIRWHAGGGLPIDPAGSGIVVPAPTPPPPPPRPDHVWLLFSWKPESQSGKPDLWLSGPLGKGKLRLTHDPDWVDLQPTFSPDGRRIAFLRAESPRGASAICVCDTDGGNLRQLATARGNEGRLLSPVWVSDSRLYFTRDRKSGGQPDTEIWEVGLDGNDPKPVFRFREALGLDSGAVTDVSPDGQKLAVIAQKGFSPSTADVYVTDLKGRSREIVWEDPGDNYADARALWSPDGERIAWQHHFTRDDPGRGEGDQVVHHGVGLARLGDDGKWVPQLQEEEDGFVVPIAWSEDSNVLLCARLHDTQAAECEAQLFLMGRQLRPVRSLFKLDTRWRQTPPWVYCGLGDWALVPGDAPLPASEGPGKHTIAEGAYR